MGIRIRDFQRRLNEESYGWGFLTGSVSPFAFLYAPPAAKRLDALDNALFICVAFLLIAGSLFDDLGDLVDTALSES